MERPFPAYQGDQAYIFVCYAHADADLVYPELVWIKECGYNIWYDEGIAPGEEWTEELAEAIEGASHFLYYVTPDSVASRYCRDEVGYALTNNKRLTAVHLVPTELTKGLQLSTGATQAILKYELNQQDYNEKLQSVLQTDPNPPGSTIHESGTPSDLLAKESQAFEPRPWRIGLIRTVAIAVVISVAVLITLGAFWYFDRQADVRWARTKALPEIERIIQVNWRDFTEAYALALEAERYIPDDPNLAQMFARSSLNIDIRTQPPGAGVYMKDYDAPDNDWHYLGETPIENARVPIGIFRWQMKKEGYETVLAAASTWDVSILGKNLLVPNNLDRTLDVKGSIPAGMVRVKGTETPHGNVDDFFIDRYEVTNEQFKAFIDGGGYTNRTYWEHEFIRNGNPLNWQEATGHFVDATGRPGPSTWLAGDFPDGSANYPVAGISWYEAAAYAKSHGRQLPTGQHWGLARGEYTSLIQYPTQGGFAVFAPFSNFQRQGPVAVGSLPGVTAYGAFDMAGNVREWCWNETPRGRLARGGAWDDNTYQFTELSQAPAFDRSAKNGFRTAFYPNPEKLPSSVFGIVEVADVIDYYAQTPVSDDVFAIYKEQFSYDKADVNATVESRDTKSAHWLHERITLEPAYGKERLIVNLFLPRNAQPPYQTVIYVPGSGSLFQSSSENLDEYFEFPIFLSFILKNGRAVLYPAYTGTFERSDAAAASHYRGDDTYAYTDLLIRVVKDFKRSIDYLETREDIDVHNLAYFGMSWGANLGAIIPAVEERLKTSILLGGGFSGWTRPEARQINYLTRVKLPVLMLNGKYDVLIPYEMSSKPMFDLLGTPDRNKVLKVYDTDHIPPRTEFIKEILAWLDRTLGPVN